MQWLRLYHDTINDPKWRVVANESGQPEANVLAVWMHMMVNASSSSDRGTLEGWNDRVVAASLGIRTEAVAAIYDAMQGMVLDGMRLTGWDKRQRSSDDINERVKRHRTKAKDTPPGGGSTNGTGKHRNVTKAERNVTPTLQTVTVTEIPLDLSYLPSNPTTLKKEDDDDAGAREIRQRVSEAAGTSGGKKAAAIVAGWLAAGYSLELDILPAVRDAAFRAPEPIASFAYFTDEIRRRYERRKNPAPVSGNVVPMRSGKPREAGAQELLDKLAAFGGLS